jgi:hypothetical protein
VKVAGYPVNQPASITSIVPCDRLGQSVWALAMVVAKVTIATASNITPQIQQVPLHPAMVTASLKLERELTLLPVTTLMKIPER